MSQKRLFLLDAYALIFRGYYAFIKNPRINSKGMDTSAIMGFMNSLMDVIKREKPDHLAVAFDKGGSDYRFEMYQEYKAHRDETPEAIKIAVPYIQELLRAMHIPIIEKPGFEADDLIGTIAKQAEKENYQVAIFDDGLQDYSIKHNVNLTINTCMSAYLLCNNPVNGLNKLEFPFTPQIDYSQDVRFESYALAHTNYQPNAYARTENPNISMSCKFAAHTPEHFAQSNLALKFLILRGME